MIQTLGLRGFPRIWIGFVINAVITMEKRRMKINMECSIGSKVNKVKSEEQKVFSPKEIIDQYLKACDEAMFKAHLVPNDNYTYMKETLRDLQLNMEKSGLKIINKGVMVY